MRHLFLFSLAACSVQVDPVVETPIDPIAPHNDITEPETTPPAPVDEPAVEEPTDTTRPIPSPILSGDDAIRLSPTSFAVVAPDEGGLWMYDTNHGTRFVNLNAEVTSVARVGQDLLVTSRDTGDIIQLQMSTSLQIKARIPVGAEPFDVVPAPDARTMWVSLSMEDAVVEIDATTGLELRRWHVEGEPRSMALRSNGELIVATAMTPDLTYIDTITGSQETRPLTEVLSPRSSLPMVPRVTGRMHVDSGDTLLVPTLYADTTVNSNPTIPLVPYYGNMETRTGSVTMFTHGVVSIECCGTDDGVLFLSSALDPMTFGPVSGMLTNVTSTTTTDGTPILIATSNAGALVMFDRRTKFPVIANVERNPLVAEVFGEGPRGLVLLSNTADRVWTTAAHEGLVVSVDLDDMDPRFSNPFSFLLPPTHVEYEAELPPTRLPSAVYEGRRLFHSNGDSQVAMVGTGASCAGCHMDGRTDGRTWEFNDFPRQTPSLAGMVSHTAPFTWANEVATVQEEALSTSQVRMAGSGMNQDAADAIAAYVDWTRLPEQPVRSTAERQLIAQGDTLFHDATVGCATCHAGSTFQDGGQHLIIGGDAVNTPSLLGVRATAPYMHDGSRATLADVLDLSNRGVMGNTGHLTRQERQALLAYVRSL